MSRVCQGGLEVERYIGSCLISSTVRPSVQKTVNLKKDQSGPRNCYSANNYPGTSNEQCQYGTWTGAPLISMTSSPRRSNQQQSSPSSCQHSPVEQHHHQQQQQQQLSSTQQQVTSHLQTRSPLSRLAIHTQGAPLILAGRFHNRTKTQTSNVIANNNNFSAMTIGRFVPSRGARNCEPARKPQQSISMSQSQQISVKSDQCQSKSDNTSGVSIANIDSLSIASDESSNNSENSLPRIIKPRKRRKKDRKPTNSALNSQDPKPEDASVTAPIVAHSPEQPCLIVSKQYAYYEQRKRPPVTRDNYTRYYHNKTSHELVDTRQRYRQVKVLDDNRNVMVSAPGRSLALTKGYRQHHPNVSMGRNHTNAPRFHGYEACEKSDLNAGACQCRYCDPSGLIWDVDSNGYSPFLTPPNNYVSHVPLGYLPRVCQERSEFFHMDLRATNGRHEREPTGTVLRRSWSDPSSYFSDQFIVPNRYVGVIGDRGPTAESVNRGRSSWPGGASYVSLSSNVSDVTTNSAPTQSLEVSTEIVTSPNGHRDLEIKFYSSSPSAGLQVGEKSSYADDEDYSDIWSYHESKLQQDFRTLLQAEE